jgi:hypothetical protein
MEAEQVPAVDPLMTEEQLAEYLNLSIVTLRHWRREGRGPRAILIHNKTTRYRIRDVTAWLDTSFGDDEDDDEGEPDA